MKIIKFRTINKGIIIIISFIYLIEVSLTSIIFDNLGDPFLSKILISSFTFNISVLFKLIIFSFVVAILYILGIYYSANSTASGITSLICCAINNKSNYII
jgi:hypothetical protein